MPWDTLTIDDVEYRPTKLQRAELHDAWVEYCDECSRIDAERHARQVGQPLVLDDDFAETREAYKRFCDRAKEIVTRTQGMAQK